MRSDRAFVLLSLVLASAVAVLASGPGVRPQGGPEPITWSAVPEPASGVVRPGGRLTLVVAAAIEEGWHIYGVEELPGGPRPLRIALKAGQAFTAGRVLAPDPVRDFDAAFGQVITFYDKPASFRLPVTVPPKARVGKASIDVDVAFQACDGRICLPSRTVRLSVPIVIRRAGARIP